MRGFAEIIQQPLIRLGPSIVRSCAALTQHFRFQARSKIIGFLLNHLFEEARQSFLQGGSPAAAWVLKNKNVLGGLYYPKFSGFLKVPESKSLFL